MYVRTRPVFDSVAGDQLVVVGDDPHRLALMRADALLALTDQIRRFET
jgi:hypothetical protein